MEKTEPQYKKYEEEATRKEILKVIKRNLEIGNFSNTELMSIGNTIWLYKENIAIHEALNNALIQKKNSEALNEFYKKQQGIGKSDECCGGCKD